MSTIRDLHVGEVRHDPIRQVVVTAHKHRMLPDLYEPQPKRERKAQARQMLDVTDYLESVPRDNLT